MFNKLKFNNLVITNKKKIQQGRVQTISKLVHKIRKTKLYLEKRPDDEKLKERLRKCTIIMEELKQLKRLEVLKRILLLDKSPTAVISNNRSTPDEISVAMLAMNKIISDLANQFKVELGLCDENRSWREELIQTSKRRAKIIRTEEKRQKRKILKDQKALSRKRSEWLQENKPNSDLKGNVKEQVDSPGGTWDVVSLEEPKAAKVEVSKETLTSNQCKQHEDKQLGICTPAKLKRQKLPKPVESVKKTVAKDTLQKNYKPINTEVIHTAKPIEGAENPKAKIEVIKVADPFFVTEQGESYLSTAVVTHIDESDDWQIDGKLKAHSNVYQRNMRMDTRPIESNRRNRRAAELMQRGARPELLATKQTENMHPSWVAKQKMKPTISTFQGKKIVFNDDGGETVAAQDSASRSGVNGNIRRPTSQASDVGQLHPSWVAKQKMKPKISVFQGTKIKFDDAHDD